MRLPTASLGFKLNFALLFFLLLLGGATAGIILYGFGRTELNARTSSQEALEDLGREYVTYLASAQANAGVLQLEWATDSGQSAARYMVEQRQIAPPPAIDASKLTRTFAGVLYDPDPNRRGDLLMPNFAPVTPAALQDMTDSQALDAIAPTIFHTYPDRARQASFDALSFFYASVNHVYRHYPPIGMQNILAADEDVTPQLELYGPVRNPSRKTIWSPVYDDIGGNGQVITAYTPVYDGDVYKGYIGIDLSISQLLSQINDLKITESGFAFYLDQRGNLLPSNAFNLISRETSDGNEALLATRDAMNRGEGGVTRVFFHGREFFVAYAPLEHVGGSLAVASPVDEITVQAAAVATSIETEANRTLMITLCGMLALFILGLALASWLNRRMLVQPIEGLVSGTRAVAAGNLETALPVRGEDELAVLAQSFNQMTGDLRSRRDALQAEIAERRAAQEELRALFDAMTDSVVVVSREGRYLRVPSTNAPPYLMAPADLTGKMMQDVMPANQADGFLAEMRSALDAQHTNIIEYPLVIDEKTYWFSAAISPVSADVALIVARDITDRMEAQQELERRVLERTRELSAILEVSKNVASTISLEPLLALIIEEVKGIADYSRCSIFLTEGEHLFLLGGRSTSGEVPPSMRIARADVQPLWDRIGVGEYVIIDDVRAEDDELAAAYRRGSGNLLDTAFKDIHSWMGVPLMAQDTHVGMLTLSHVEAGFYNHRHATLATAIASQIATAIANARLYEQSQQLAAVQERQRLARELHDSVSQALYGIALGARTARTLLDRQPEKAIDPMDYVLQLADAGLAEMRALIFELRPESLEMEGLVAALEKQIAATSARYGIEVTSELGEEPGLDLAEKEVFYRIGQEALHNMVKHARATKARVRLVRENGDLVLEVGDNGIGFDTDGSFPGHIGLVSMRERARSVNAELAVSSTPNVGTTIRLSRHFED